MASMIPGLQAEVPDSAVSTVLQQHREIIYTEVFSFFMEADGLHSNFKGDWLSSLVPDLKVVLKFRLVNKWWVELVRDFIARTEFTVYLSRDPKTSTCDDKKSVRMHAAVGPIHTLALFRCYSSDFYKSIAPRLASLEVIDHMGPSAADDMEGLSLFPRLGFVTFAFSPFDSEVI